ncbi:MAG: cobalamin biosynthesis protein CbiD [Methanobacteriales archaeon]|nr:cobalamin biosynthesis protein CbiD [Methanobacteriales archaeon]
MDREGQGQEYGITTGTAAAAAAVAALLSLERAVDFVPIETPLGKLEVLVEDSKKLGPDHGWATVRKMPYPDPDVTQNLEIQAEVQLKTGSVILIQGGDGVGTVTKPGLQVAIGEKAINPVPRAMIHDNLQNILPENKGVEVTISIPQGREVAKRTMNPRLGIVDGISILGTTGIARPMSQKSYQESLKCQLDVALAEGYDELIFVPGNIGEKLAQDLLNVDQDQIIHMGNHVGFMFQEARIRGLDHLILLGHAGKLVKLAAGIFNTEHKRADGRREVITAHAGLMGASKHLMEFIFNCNTTEEMISILREEGLVQKVFNSISTAIKNRVLEVYGINLDVLIMEMDGTILNNNHQIVIAN